MLYISKIKVKGLFGAEEFFIDLKRDVNFFIGPNGTGKTTVIKFISYVLEVDLKSVQDLPAEGLDIYFQTKSGSDVFFIEFRKEKSYENNLKYCFGQCSGFHDLLNGKILETTRKKIGNLEMLFGKKLNVVSDYGGVDLHFSEGFNFSADINDTSLRSLISDFVSLSWMSVGRKVFDEFELREDIDLIDQKIKEQNNGLLRYFSFLNSRKSKLMDGFMKESLRVSLRIVEKDNLDRDAFGQFGQKFKEFIDHKQELGLSFNFFELIDKRAIQKMLELLKLDASEVSDLGSRDSFVIVSALLFVHNILEMAKLKKRYDKRVEELFLYKKKWEQCLAVFIKRKKLRLSESGDVCFFYFDKEKNDDIEIDITKLSSGEKQLYVLLTEALLQRGFPSIFIADEPELSLHIEWQADLVDALMSINPKAQLIMATHSPDIVGLRSENAFNMEDYVHVE